MTPPLSDAELTRLEIDTKYGHDTNPAVAKQILSLISEVRELRESEQLRSQLAELTNEVRVLQAKVLANG